LKFNQIFQPSRLKRHPQDFIFPRRYFRRRVKGISTTPAYFFHQLEVSEFQSICKQLVSSGIRTATFGELLDGQIIDGPAVLITLDDWWSSTWSIAFPLARKFGLRFTLFVSPSAIQDTDECRTTLDDGVNQALLESRDSSSNGALTWGEIRVMDKSGIFDVQSHSLHHGVVFSSDILCGFVTPEGPFPLPSMTPLISNIQGADVIELSPPLGTPLYKWGPALSAQQRFIENYEVRVKCIQFVEQNGGPLFFNQEGWKDTLLDLIDHMEKGHWESQEERHQRYRRDLLQSKMLIEKQLTGASVRALAPPWAVMHPDLPQIAKEIGYEIIVLGYPFHHSKGSPLPIYPRLFGDAIWNLIDMPILGSIKWLRARHRNISRRKKGAIP
jgi:peptidoglycan/xylan/chitin deacetylase (PgdA/CDA1 family)